MKNTEELNKNIEINIKSVDDGNGNWTTAIDAPERASLMALIAIFRGCEEQIYDRARANKIPEEVFEEAEFQDLVPN